MKIFVSTFQNFKTKKHINMTENSNHNFVVGEKVFGFHLGKLYSAKVNRFLNVFKFFIINFFLKKKTGF